MSDFNDLIGNLKRFNRKERFILLNYVLRDAFRIDPRFAGRLEHELKCPVVPDDAFVAMDYHLDWLHVALELSKGRMTHHEGGKLCNRGLFGGTQEDTDILIAFANCENTHLILIEAKADTGWNPNQLCSKAERYRQIFGDDGTQWDGVTPHFILMSPPKAPNTDEFGFPKKPHWLPLPLDQRLLKITRCDENMKQSEKGAWLRFERLTKSSYLSQNEPSLP